MGRFCVKCGAELNKDAKFCTKCGSQVEIEVSDIYVAPVESKENEEDKKYEENKNGKKGIG